MRTRTTGAVAGWAIVLVALLGMLAVVVTLPFAVRRTQLGSGFLHVGAYGHRVVLVGFAAVVAMAAWGVLCRFVVGALRWAWMLSGLALAVAAIDAGRFTSLLLAFATFAAAQRIGRTVIGTVGSGSLGGPDRRVGPLVVEVGVGLSIVQAVLMPLGVVGGFRAPLAWLIVGIGVASVVHLALVAQRSGPVAPVPPVERWARSLVPLGLIPAWGWLVPPDVQYDALYAKAWLPEVWATMERLFILRPHPVLGNVGSGLVLAVPGHLLGAVETGRYLQVMAGLVLLHVPVQLARGTSPARRLAAAVVALALLCTGQFIWQLATTFDDLLIALACLAMCVFVVERHPRIWTTRDALVAGILVGGTLSAKLHVIGFVIGTGVGVLFALGRSIRVRLVAASAAGALATSLYPFVWRWVATGNPVFPQFNDVFRSPDYLPINQTYNQPYDKAHRLVDAVLLPFRATMNPSRYVEVMPGGGYGVLPIGFAAVLLLLVAKRTRIAGIGLLFGFAFWWVSFRYLRYGLPLLICSVALLPAVSLPEPLWSVVGAVRRAWDRLVGRRRLQTALTAGASIALVMLVIPPTVAGFWNVPGAFPAKRIMRQETSRDYLGRALLELGAIDYVNANAARGDRLVGSIFERTLMRRDIDASPTWEFNEQVALRAPGLTPKVAWKQLGARWFVVPTGVRVAGGAGIDPTLLEAPAALRWAGNGYEVYELFPSTPASVVRAQCDPLSAAADGTLACSSALGATVRMLGPQTIEVQPACSGSVVSLDVGPAGSTVEVVERESGALRNYAKVVSMPASTPLYQASSSATSAISFGLDRVLPAFDLAVRPPRSGGCA